jgi:hypothetical protein
MLQGRLDILSEVQKESENHFELIKRNKIEATPESLCIGICSVLLPITREIMKLKFDEDPDYNKLQFMLLKCLLDNEIVLSQEYDWMVRNPMTSLQSSQRGYQKDS